VDFKSLITFSFYCLIIILQWLRFHEKINISQNKLITLLIIPIALHGYLLYKWIDTIHGQNLSIINILSLSLWLTTILTVITFISKKSVYNLLILMIPLTAITILPSEFLQYRGIIIKTVEEPNNLTHIIMFIITLSVLIMAAIQATIVIGQNYVLKHSSNSKFNHNIIKFLPPLEDTEKFLFKIIDIGFIILTIAIISVFLTLKKISFNANNIHFITLIIVFITWILFAVLLYQRKKNGLRGSKVNYVVLLSVIVLLASFISHKYMV